MSKGLFDHSLNGTATRKMLRGEFTSPHSSWTDDVTWDAPAIWQTVNMNRASVKMHTCLRMLKRPEQSFPFIKNIYGDRTQE